MPGELKYMSPTAGSHGYAGHPPAPNMELPPPRRVKLVNSRAVDRHDGAHDKYKGIRYRAELGRYISEIRPTQPKKRKIWLGTYKTAEEAARAFDAGVFYTKKLIPYNFEDSPEILEPLPDGLSPEDEHVAIQKKAKAAAARAQPVDLTPPTSTESRVNSDDRKPYVVTKMYNHHASFHRHSYNHDHHHYNHDHHPGFEGQESYYQRHEIPTEHDFFPIHSR